MRRFAVALAWAAVGYATAVVASYFLVAWLSFNAHDHEMEAAMTSFFFYGPVGALVAGIAAFVRKMR